MMLKPFQIFAKKARALTPVRSHALADRGSASSSTRHFRLLDNPTSMEIHRRSYFFNLSIKAVRLMESRRAVSLWLP
jgi:hypothetical protein